MTQDTTRQQEREPKCQICGAPATCFGTYEGHTGYGCDTCCLHGNEDGECVSLTASAPVEQPEPVLRGPTDAEVDDACMWYRHDYGLLDRADSARVRYEAKEWLRAWCKVRDLCPPRSVGPS